MANALETARFEVAERAFEEADFEGREVAGSSGWESDGADRLVRTVFLENPIGDSIAMQMSVDFEEGSTENPGLDFELPEDPSSLFGFYVNLDERGEYRADVRDIHGVTVFEYSSNDEGVIELVEDGFLAHARDLEGLASYLQERSVIPASAELLDASDFEARLEPFSTAELQPGF